jgi:hypothetical protein
VQKVFFNQRPERDAPASSSCFSNLRYARQYCAASESRFAEPITKVCAAASPAWACRGPVTVANSATVRFCQRVALDLQARTKSQYRRVTGQLRWTSRTDCLGVEDEPLIRMDMAAIIEEAGFKVYEAFRSAGQRTQ